MTGQYRYRLERTGRKRPCPSCGEKRFVRYTDTGGDGLLPEAYGRCDREIKCAYHLSPYKDGYARAVWEQERGASRGEAEPYKPPPPARPCPAPASLVPDGVFRLSLGAHDQNNLVLFLEGILGTGTARRVIDRYHVGSFGHWPGDTVFWQVDGAGRVRGGKVMLYDPHTGGRVKQPFPHITWVHRALKMEGYNLRQCLFGEHLLHRHPAKPVALVESEKTALVASAFFPEFVWLAVGSLSGLSLERCRVLQGRTVVLFPDLGAYGEWGRKAAGLEGGLPRTRVSVSDILERHGTEAEREAGLDLADYLVRFDLRHFREAVPEPAARPAAKPGAEGEKGAKGERPETKLFPGSVASAAPEHPPVDIPSPAQDVQGLVRFFSTATLPEGPVLLGPGVTVTDIPAFVGSHWISPVYIEGHLSVKRNIRHFN